MKDQVRKNVRVEVMPVAGWPLDSGKDVRAKHVLKVQVCSKRIESCHKGGRYAPQVEASCANKSHIRKRINHHQLIIETREMKN
jgi:hypothetical protein